MRQINEGRAVDYNNVEIEGDLDLTNLENRRQQQSVTNRSGDHHDSYESTVEVLVGFTNCTFPDDVIAYYHDDREKNTYVAHFEKDVLFRNCIFKGASEFKYS